MMAFLVWTFASFWRFAGVLVLLSALFEGIASVVAASRAPRALGEE